ncbi:XRE family transcriptional regulator [Streptomyces sp. NPDC005899]|uniref:XRE family transcriptional regulator n=1 Tax=Streptomyces sp. NPDC005899 TaxID=3155716 RepID=UPI0033E0F7C8
MSTRSHPDPQLPTRKGPAVDAGRAGHCTEAIRDIAEDAVVVTDNLLHRAFDPTSTTSELLQLFDTLATLVQEGTAALVVRHRSHGLPLSDLAPDLRLSEDRIRKKYNPRSIDQQLATRARPLRTSRTAATAADDVRTTKNLLRLPRQRLACALTRMWKQSRVPQATLARHMNIDPSYVSRMLSGDRDVALHHVRSIAEKCGADINLVVPLWEAANSVETTTDPVLALRAYLRALHYAAGSPSHARILTSTQRTITKAEVRQALEGPGVPGWHVVRPLTIALQSMPENTRPLWRKAHSAVRAGNTGTVPAAAFG